MSEKKPQNPWVITGLTIAAIFSLWLVWDTFADINAADDELQESIDSIQPPSN